MENPQGRTFLADVSGVFCGGAFMDDLVRPLQPKSLVGTRFAVTQADVPRAEEANDVLYDDPRFSGILGQSQSGHP